MNLPAVIYLTHAHKRPYFLMHNEACIANEVIEITEEALLRGLSVASMGGISEMSLLDYAQGVAATLSVAGLRFALVSDSLPRILLEERANVADNSQTNRIGIEEALDQRGKILSQTYHRAA